MKSNKVVQAFSRSAEEYDRWFETAAGKILFVLEIAASRMLMHDLKRPFLEIGVGTGKCAEALGSDYGSDPSSTSLAIAAGRGVRVVTARGESLPFEDKSFGAVFLLFALCFVDDPARVLSEARRVLVSKGALLIGIINRDSP